MSVTLPDTLSQLASKNHGLLKQKEITDEVSRMTLSRLVRAEVLERVRPGIFRKKAKNQTDEQALLAVCWWIDEENTFVSHRSAARHHGLVLDKGPLEVTTSSSRSTGRVSGVVVHRSRDLKEGDTKRLRGIPVTTGARTIIDLATQLDAETLAILVEEAWRKKIAPPDWIARRLDELGHGRDTGALSEIISDCRKRDEPFESALEVKFWRLLKKENFPLPKCAYEFRDDFGQPGHVDFAYPDYDLAIECDGWEFHGTREAFENDRLRSARLAAVGWRVMAITWRQLTEEPKKVLERLKHALKFRAQSAQGPATQ